MAKKINYFEAAATLAEKITELETSGKFSDAMLDLLRDIIEQPRFYQRALARHDVLPSRNRSLQRRVRRDLENRRSEVLFLRRKGGMQVYLVPFAYYKAEVKELIRALEEALAAAKNTSVPQTVDTFVAERRKTGGHLFNLED
jgi:hypothetical protein